MLRLKNDVKKTLNEGFFRIFCLPCCTFMCQCVAVDIQSKYKIKEDTRTSNYNCPGRRYGIFIDIFWIRLLIFYTLAAKPGMYGLFKIVIVWWIRIVLIWYIRNF